MPHDKPDYHRSGRGSVQHAGSQPDDAWDGAYDFEFDYDSDVLTDRGDRKDPSAFGVSRGHGDRLHRDGRGDRDSGYRWEHPGEDDDYRPEVDYDPDYQDDHYEELSDHAQQFQRVSAEPEPLARRATATRTATSTRTRPSRSARPEQQARSGRAAKSSHPAASARKARRDPRRVPPPRRRGWVRWVAVAGLILVALAGVGTAIAYRYADTLITGQQTSVGGTAVAEVGEPINILVVGSDSREGLSGEQLNQTTEDVGGKRTDTIMVLHVNPEQKKAVLVSVPRDLRTEVNGEVAKINAAGSGGPSLLLKTVEETTGLDINHYVEVNFAGFLKVVDTVGGVELCNRTGEPLVDEMAGLKMPPGCHNVKGQQALAFVRARYIDSDFGRIERQQQFMRALLQKISSAGNLINIPKLVQLANDLSGAVTTDEAFSASEALKIARGMGSLSLDDVDMRTYPSEGRGPECDGCPAFVHPLPEAEILMQAIASEAKELPPVGLTGKDNVTLAGTTLRVVNGGEVRGAAADAAESLEELGFTTSVDGNTETPIGPTTQVQYGENMPEEARLLRYLLRGHGIQVELVPADPEGGPGPNSLSLVIGGNWKTLDGQTGQTGQAPAPDATQSEVPDLYNQDTTGQEPGADLSDATGGG